MIKIACQPVIDKREHFDLLVLPFWEGLAEAAELGSWRELIAKVLESGDFKGKNGESTIVYDDGRILLLGLGKQETICPEAIRRAYSAAVRVAASKKISVMHAIFPKIAKMEHENLLRAVSEGILLTNYSFARLKNESLKDNPVVLLEKVQLIGLSSKDDSLISKYSTVAAGVHLVRELVNGNADDVTPDMLAETAKSLEKRTSSLKSNVLDRKQIEKEKMGLLLAVNRGSARDPYLATLSYQGNPRSKEHIVLIGKGVTYDTGGLCLKTADGMLTMKTDMAGAATVLATVHTAAVLKLKVNVTAVAPLTENAIDAKSYKLGDVYTAMSGKTVEITNTDAEGRLVLADAMTYAIKYLRPTAMIDVATLTGGIVAALGEDIAGLFANNEQLVSELQRASEATGENLWRMPLYSDYKETLKSEIADLINCAIKAPSSITAALFLQEFCQSIPWAHIDFAGTSYHSKPKFINMTKATGYGVRLLIDFLERHSA